MGQIAVLQKEIDGLEDVRRIRRQIAVLQKEIDALNNEIEQTIDRVNLLELIRREKSRGVPQYSPWMTRASRRYRSAEDDVDVLKAHITVLQASVMHKMSQIAELQEEIDALEDVRRIRSQIAVFQEHIDLLRNAIQETRDHVAAAEDRASRSSTQERT